MKIIISNDHAATPLKYVVKDYLTAKGSIEIIDQGSQGEPAADYPEYAYKAAKAIAAGEADYAILLCGTGAGMCIAASKVKGIRAVVCSEPYTARLSREHNDAQILCLGARVIGEEMAKMIIDEFIKTPFSTEERHVRRVQTFMGFEGQQ